MSHQRTSFGCQELICAPRRSNAFLIIYLPSPASDFAQSPDRPATGSNVLSGPVFCFMRNDKTIRSRPAPPRCPSCAQVMRRTRRTQRFNGLPDLYVFECRTCELTHAEEGAPPSESKLGTEIGPWYLDEFGNPTREIKRRD
jgi:hypothetical protein